MIKEKEKHIGQFDIKIKNKDGTIEEFTKFNRIMDSILNSMINIFDGITPDLTIKYLAIGTGSTPITDTDTQLDTEIFRTQFLTSNLTSTGQFTTTYVILDNEAVGTWEEIGIFAGSGATAAANSGTLVSRILFNFNKTALQEVDITRIDQVSRT